MSTLTLDSDIMKNAKREMIGMIRASIDLDRLRDFFDEQYSFQDADEISFKDGDTIVYNDQVAVQLNYKVGFTLSVLIDGEGNPMLAGVQEDSETESADDPVEEAGSQAGQAAQSWGSDE